MCVFDHEVRFHCDVHGFVSGRPEVVAKKFNIKMAKVIIAKTRMFRVVFGCHIFVFRFPSEQAFVSPQRLPQRRLIKGVPFDSSSA